MADTTQHRQPPQKPQASRRNEKVGLVVSTKMQKTIVVEIEMRKAHPKYKRVMKSNKKFYAHDEQNSARVGDVVRIREARPLSKLKRWSLEEIVRRSSLSRSGREDGRWPRAEVELAAASGCRPDSTASAASGKQLSGLVRLGPGERTCQFR